MGRRRWRRLVVIAAAGASLLGVTAAVTASSGSPKPATPKPATPKPAAAAPHATGPAGTSSPVPVIVPGRPGQSASVLPADEIVAPDGSRYAEVDAWFVRMMIPHHTQAVQMATLAPGRARNPWIVAVAERVRAAQLPEIARLKAWLRARGLGEEDPSGHEHGSMQGMSMRGMQSPEALRALAATRDDGFDRMFVAMMCEHHQGAIDMATAVLTVVSNLEVEEMATAIAAEQSSEITRMREVIGG